MLNFGKQINAVEALIRAKTASGLQDNSILALVSLSRRGVATREEVLVDIGHGSLFVADRALNGLEKAGLAERARDQDDKRSITWSITDQGRLSVRLFITAIVTGPSKMTSSQPAEEAAL